MKIRNGFVSNSSSTSFCIYGAKVEAELDKKLPEGLHYHYGDPNYEPQAIYIGREWSSIGDQETGFQFKQSVEHALEALTGSSHPCSTIEESYYNG